MQFTTTQIDILLQALKNEAARIDASRHEVVSKGLGNGAEHAAYLREMNALALALRDGKPVDPANI